MPAVKKETDGGIIVSGAKVVATSAAITHYNFMGQSSKTATEDLDMSLMFMVPISAPGLKLICRTSYEARRRATARRSTIRCRRASMRTTRSSSWIRCSFRGRTFSSTAIRRGLSFFRAPASCTGPVPGLHALRGEARFHFAACWRRRCAAPAATRRAATRCCWARSSPGATCSGRCRTRWPTIPPMEWRRGAAQSAGRPGLSRVRAGFLSSHQGHRRSAVTSALIYLPSSVKDFANPAIEPYLRAMSAARTTSAMSSGSRS
jgi:4-hydroxyphenylacetate 3-monooxygenase